MSSLLLALSTSQIAVIACSSVLVLLIIVSIVVAATKGTKTLYDKDAFEHHVMQPDFSVRKQVLSFLEGIILIAGVILYFTNVLDLYPAIAAFGVLILLQIYNIGVRLAEKKSRIEYNTNELSQYFSFSNKPRIIKWEDMAKVEASNSMGRNRKIIFKNKSGSKKIIVSAKLVGFYDFMVFSEKQLEGKKFESIKIAKARQ